jgi:hypothetical protein
MVWEANTNLLTYNAKYKSTIKFINAVNLHRKFSKSEWTKINFKVKCDRL